MRLIEARERSMTALRSNAFSPAEARAVTAELDTTSPERSRQAESVARTKP
jgi:hypothetical protein